MYNFTEAKMGTASKISDISSILSFLSVNRVLFCPNFLSMLNLHKPKNVMTEWSLFGYILYNQWVEFNKYCTSTVGITTVISMTTILLSIFNRRQNNNTMNQ